MLDDYKQNFLPSGQTVVDGKGSPNEILRQLLLAFWNRSGKGTGVPVEVDANISAAGTTQATATQLAHDWSEVLATAAGAGVKLLNLKAGQSQFVFNGGANALKVYPATGWGIDALAVNAAYSLAAGKTQIFRAVTPTLVRSVQLG